MKKLIPIVVVFVFLLLIGAAALSWFLSKGLKPAFDKARPSIEETLGTTLEIDDLSVQILRGRLTADGIQLGNPEGFDAFPHLFSLSSTRNQINLGDLILKQQITLDEIRVEESNLYVIRKADGRTNVQVLLEALQPEQDPSAADETPAAPEEPPSTEEAAPAELPAFLLNRFLLTSALAFVQERENKDPLNLGIDLQIEALNIGTVGNPKERSGEFSITGNLSGDKDLFVMNMTGTMAPITDPTAPTFEINGQIESLEMDVLRVFSRDVTLANGMADLRVALKADQGIFAEGSELVLHIANPEFGEKINIPPRAVPAALSVVIPVRGTVMAPDISFGEAMKESIRTTVLGAPQEALNAKTDAMKAEAQAQADAMKEEAAAKSEAMKEEAQKQKTQLLEDAKSGNLDLEKPKGSLGGLLGGSSSKAGDDSTPESSGSETEAKKPFGSKIPGFGGGESEESEEGTEKKNPLKGFF
jgi:hypothetical protein